MTEQQWRCIVELVNGKQNSSATQTTMTIETAGGSGEMSITLTSDANSTSTIHSISLLNEEPNNPVTIDCDFFSDIENGKDDEKYKGSSWLRVTKMRYCGRNNTIMRDLTNKL
jgi:hypothetical protein